MKEKLAQYINNINQLSADTQHEEDYNILRTKLESIITWCNAALVVINRLSKGVEK